MLASESDPDSAAVIRKAIGAVTHEQVNDADVARVRSHLAAGGWPLAAGITSKTALVRPHRRQVRPHR